MQAPDQGCRDFRSSQIHEGTGIIRFELQGFKRQQELKLPSLGR